MQYKYIFGKVTFIEKRLSKDTNDICADGSLHDLFFINVSSLNVQLKGERRDQHPEEAGRRFEEAGVGKVKLPCETRRADRHSTLEEFREMCETILDCLTAISNNEGNKIM